MTLEARPTVRYFRPLKSSGPVDLLLEPAERLGRHGEREEADDVELEDVLGQLAIELVAAAVIEPAHVLVGVGAVDRAGAEQRGGAVLAVPVGRHAPVRIEHAVRRRVHHRERLHHGAGIEEVDLQPAAAHLVDLGDIVAAVVAEDVGRAEAALHLQGDGLRARNLRHGDGRHAGDSGAAEELAAGRSRSCFFLVISYPPLD